MNQKKAKRIKREVYGDYSPKFRKYYIDKNGTIFADRLRRLYKKAKQNG
jgi:hypothetical protein